MPRFNQNRARLTAVAMVRQIVGLGGGATRRRADGAPATSYVARPDRQGAAARCSSSRRRSATSSEAIVGFYERLRGPRRARRICTFFPWPPRGPARARSSPRTRSASAAATPRTCSRSGACTASTRSCARHGRAGSCSSGASAGMICWFEAGVTDSFGPQLDGMRRPRLPPGQRLPALRRRGAAPAALPRARRRGLPGGHRRRRRRRAPLRRHRAARGGHLPARRGGLPRHPRGRGQAARARAP